MVETRNNIPGLCSTASGRAKVFVVNSDGSVAKEYPWKSNIILNSGLDAVCTVCTFAAAFSVCLVGTGQTPTIDNYTSTATATQSGGTLTVSGYDLQSINNQYNVIKLTSGEEFMIQSVTGPTTAIVTPVIPEISTPTGFKIYRTNQSQLVSYSKKTTTYISAGNGCGTTLVSATGTVIMKRTVEFSAESGPISYYELGFSWQDSATATLFNRMVFPAGIPLVSGQKLRIVYELNVVQGGLNSTPSNVSVAGWPIAPATDVSGNEKAECWGLGKVNTDGTAGAIIISQAANPIYFAEPSQGGIIGFTSVSYALKAFGDGLTMQWMEFSSNNNRKWLGIEAYIPRSFYSIKYASWTETEANKTDARSIYLGVQGLGDVWSGYRLLTNQNQTKTSLGTLTLKFKVAVSRTFGVW